MVEASNSESFDKVMSQPSSEQPEQSVIAGFWQRLLALFIDSLLLGIVGVACGLFLFDQLAALGGWGRCVGFTIALGYFGFLNSAIGGGQTLGKGAMKIKVVNREGQHISLGRSILRYAILGVPFFLNGALISSNVLMSPVGYLISFVLFGFGGAIVYLYLFNRHTRQSLHDLLVGTFVTRTTQPGKVVGTVWRPHLLVVGIWFLAVSSLLVVTTGLSKRGVFPELLETQKAIQATGKVHIASVSVGKSWQVKGDGSSESTYFCSTAIWKHRLLDHEAAARSVASVILRNYPEIMKKDELTVNITYGFDIGIARAWKCYTVSYSPSECLAVVDEIPGD